MTITEVRVRPMARGARIRAAATITFDDCFVVHDIRVIEGQAGLFVAMPSRRLPGGDYLDIAHPINAETREMIERAVLHAYRRAVKERGQ